MNRFSVNDCPRGVLTFGLCLSVMLLWWAVVLTAPVSTGLRDSGEFMVQAVFLDIVHPAGFPLLGQLNNVMTWFPWGPLAWRVTLFAGLAAALFVAFGSGCVRQMLDRAALPGQAVGFVIPVFSLVLLMSPAMQRQLAAVEAYLLNGAFSVALVYAALRYEKSRDNRILIGSGFLTGLAAGNHVAVVVVALFVALFLVIRYRPPFAVILATALFGIAGLGVYGYLPARAMNAIPLNTGRPVDTARFFRQISDARDRELRGAERAVPADVLAVDRLSVIADGEKLFRELPLAVWIAASFGFLALLLRRVSVAVLALLPAAATYLFFSGWDPDPWTPIFGAVAMFAAVGAAVASGRFARIGGEKVTGALIGIGCVVLSASAVYPRWQQRAFDRELPAEFAAGLLDGHAGVGALIVENSWFITQYLQRIESYRREIPVIYQPSLLFPGYFAPAVLRVGDTTFEVEAESQMRDADLGALKKLIETVVLHGLDLGVEPGVLLSPIQAIVSYAARGSLVVSADRQSRYDEQYVAGVRGLLQNLAADANDRRSPSADESRNFIDNQVGAIMRFFERADRNEQIAEVVAAVCQHPETRYCSAGMWNGFAAHLIAIGDMARSTDILRQLMIAYPEQRIMFESTLRRIPRG